MRGGETRRANTQHKYKSFLAGGWDGKDLMGKKEGGKGKVLFKKRGGGGRALQENVKRVGNIQKGNCEQESLESKTLKKDGGHE